MGRAGGEEGSWGKLTLAELKREAICANAGNGAYGANS